MLAWASMGAPVKGSWGSYQAWQAEGNGNKGMSTPPWDPERAYWGLRARLSMKNPCVAA